MQKRQLNITSPGINHTSLLQSSPIKYRLRFLLLVLFNSGLVIFRNINSVIARSKATWQSLFFYKKSAVDNRCVLSFQTQRSEDAEPIQLRSGYLLRKFWNDVVAFLLFILFFSTTTFAHEQKVPRFATIKSNQVNARSGPGTTYPIDWVFISKGEPIKVVAEFEQWRKVEDVEGQGGWVHSSVLSPKRSVVIVGNNIQKLMAQNEAKSRIVAKLEPGLRCMFDRCKENWCKIKCDGYKGWIESVNIWGVLKGEED